VALESNCEDDSCVDLFEKCGGNGFNVSVACCDNDAMCTVKNAFYAQCITEARAAANIAAGWDGRALMCEEMPPDVAGTAEDMMPASNRRLLSESNCKDDTCAISFEKCGGKGFDVSISCCDPTESCVVKNAFYAQCIPKAKADANIAAGWDGRVLMCEEMPDDAPGMITSRKLLDTLMVAPARHLQQSGSYGSKDMPASYGYGSKDMVASYGYGDCETCLPTFEQCGGGDLLTTLCCETGLECVKKNDFYAQCLTSVRAESNIASQGWEGSVMECGSTLMAAPMRRLQQSGSYGSKDMAASYSYGSKDMATSYGYGDCETCLPSFEQCGGGDLPTTLCCEAGLECVKKNDFYAQCLTSVRAESNIASQGWEGSVMECGSTLMAAPMRRLQQSGSYGSKDMAASYSYGSKDMAASYGYGDCETCLPSFDQCGGGDLPTTLCCEAGLECVKKNDFYAQCLTSVRAESNIAFEGWEGSVMECGSTLMAAPMRRLQQSGSYGSKDMSASYGYGSKDMAASYGYGDCETCLPSFEQCGGGDLPTTLCCEAGLECVKKNDFYAQCLTSVRAESNIASQGWEGSVMECGSTLMAAPMRRLQQSGSYGSKDMAASYSYGSKDMSASYGYGDCETCLPSFDQCGGGDLPTTLCCEAGLECVKKNDFYAQCLTSVRAESNIALEGWEGSVMECGSTLMAAPMRRLQQSGSYGSTDMAASYGYGSKDMSASYGYGSKDMAASYGYGDCETCLPAFEQCGGGMLPTTLCCEAGLECVKKNDEYAQCLMSSDAESNIASEGWEGSVMECGSTLMAAPMRRLQQSGSYGSTDMAASNGYGSKDMAASYGYGSKDMSASYGYGSKDMAASYGYGDCETCLPAFEQCGGGMLPTTMCCEAGLECVKKNDEYAQCLMSSDAESNIASEGWEGSVMECGSTLMAAPMRRLQQSGSYGSKDMAASYGYGSKDMAASYGYGTKDMAASYGYGDCETCLPAFDQCGGGMLPTTLCCEAGLECVKKNDLYAQCLMSSDAESNIASEGWEGSVMECGSTLMAAPMRRLQQSGSYGSKDMAASYGYGSKDMAASYGYGTKDMAASYGYGDCETCLPAFDQCGGGMLPTTLCCEAGLECVKKNDLYAQCLMSSDAESNIASEGWEGSVMECGSTLMAAPMRRLKQSGSYGSKDMAASYGYGSKDMAASYGYGTKDMAASYGYGDCETCLPAFDQCGGGNLPTTLCCEAGLACVKKNDVYAQCLMPSYAESKVVSEGWEGSVMDCGSTLMAV
jgi:hypothetical protein